jgi:D-amino peptidase
MRVLPVPALIALALVLAAAPAHAQARKVYISVDLEGISGVNGNDQTSAGQPEYGRARKLMAEDANAAIRGAFAGGATEVVVNDSHGSQRNLLPEDLDPRVRLISHSFKRHGMMEGLDESFDAVLFVGYHAKAEAPRGLFAHTGSGVVRDLQINGVSVGEGGMNAAMAAWHGVAVALVTGDDAAVEEVKAIVPGVRGVAVKRAINTRAVELLPLGEARKQIEEGARQAVASAKKPAAVRSGPYKVTMRFRDVTIPEVASAFREVERPAADMVAFARDTMPDAYRLIRVLYRFINTD